MLTEPASRMSHREVKVPRHGAKPRPTMGRGGSMAGGWHRRARFGVALLGVALIAAACGGGDDSGDESASQSSTTEQETEQPPATPTGVLRMSSTLYPLSL